MAMQGIKPIQPLGGVQGGGLGRSGGNKMGGFKLRMRDIKGPRPPGGPYKTFEGMRGVPKGVTDLANTAVRRNRFFSNEAGAYQRGAAVQQAREAMVMRGGAFSGAAVQAEAAADAQVGAALAQAQAQFEGQLFSRLTELGMQDAMGRRMAEFNSKLRVQEAIAIDDATRPSGWGEFLTGAFTLAGMALFGPIGGLIGGAAGGEIQGSPQSNYTTMTDPGYTQKQFTQGLKVGSR